ncbi:MAG: hypothetical protein JRE10_15585 [Deltaproteobacteria bacterium]|nr:hypothetical protein [Deltaproteobacteria bacterium]
MKEKKPSRALSANLQFKVLLSKTFWFQVSGVRYQLIRFLLLKPDTWHLKPDCKAFAQKINKLMGENHFNKSVMLPMEQVNQLDGDFYV